MYSNTTTGILIALLLLMESAVPQARAGELDVSGELRLVSDYVFHGVSQTMSRPAVQGMLAVDHGSGWYGYGWASNVDFTEPGDVADGASAEINIGVGYVHQIIERATLSFERTDYLFPGTRDGFDYDYTEWRACLALDEKHSLGVGYSDNVFGSGAVGLVYVASTGLDLTGNLGIDVEFGYYDLSRAYDATYRYSEFALRGGIRAFDWRLGYVMTAAEAATLFPASTVSDRVVLEIGLAF